jgi:hypothetical protein
VIEAAAEALLSHTFSTSACMHLLLLRWCTRDSPLVSVAVEDQREGGPHCTSTFPFIRVPTAVVPEVCLSIWDPAADPKHTYDTEITFLQSRDILLLV